MKCLRIECGNHTTIQITKGVFTQPPDKPAILFEEKSSLKIKVHRPLSSKVDARANASNIRKALGGVCI
jgi:hypothetical protein